MSSEAPPKPPLVVSENQPLPLEYHPNIDHIVTEDGASVDNQFSEKQQRLLTESLYASWQPGEPFVAMSNVGLFFAIRTPPFVPDTLVSLGVSCPTNPFPKQNRSYFVWEYGKPPDVAVEIVSNDEGGEDTIKFKGYAKIGITYYVIYDPETYLSSQAIRVYRLLGGRYELDKSENPILESIGLGVRLWQGTYEDMPGTWLRWTATDGQILRTGKELALTEKQRADTEKQRADVEQQRAEAERQRADAEQQRALEAEREIEQLKAKLKQLGQ